MAKDVRDAFDAAPIASRPIPRAGGRARLAALVQLEQLVRVAMLLVVVDQTRVRRRRDHGVERPADVQVPRVAVLDRRVRVVPADARKPLEALERVEV